MESKEVHTLHETVHDASQRKELRSTMGVWSVSALAVVLPGAWSFAASALVIGIYGGGPAVEIWGTLAVGAALSIFCLNLAEYGSAFPNAGGCTYIATQLGGPKYGRMMGYFVGVFHSCTVAFIPPVLILVLAELTFTFACIFHEAFVPARWQIWLLFQLYNIGFLLAIKYGNRGIAMANGIGIFVLVTGLIVTIGVMLGMSAGNKRPSDAFVWTSFQNGSGWPSSVAGALLGLLGPLYAYGPPHWLLNMADDVENLSRNIPIAMIAQQAGNIATVFAFYIAVYYCINDYEGLLDTEFPSIIGELYLQGTGSKGAAFVLLLFVFIASLFGNFSYISANIRLLYGFFRGGSVPFGNWFGKVDHKYNLPVNVLYTCMFVNFLMSFIYLGTSTGFNIIIDSANFFYSLGFLPLTAASLITKRKYLDQNRGFFKMNYILGTACEIFSFIFNLGSVVVEALPGSWPVTAENMNYASVFGIAGILLATFGWIFHGRKHYLVHMVDGIEYDTSQPTNEVDVDSKPPEKSA